MRWLTEDIRSLARLASGPRFRKDLRIRSLVRAIATSLRMAESASDVAFSLVRRVSAFPEIPFMSRSRPSEIYAKTITHDRQSSRAMGGELFVVERAANWPAVAVASDFGSVRPCLIIVSIIATRPPSGRSSSRLKRSNNALHGSQADGKEDSLSSPIFQRSRTLL